MALVPAPPSITEEEFERFRDFFYRRTGISFGENKRYFVDRRLLDRIQKTGSTSFQKYFSLLRVDTGSEMERLINSFTINETYFYREDHQLRCLTNSILADVVEQRRGEKRVRIWSMPCSTGEEPYSIAIWLLENWADVDHYDVEIVGSDIDTDALELARRGVYDERSTMRLSPELRHRYFSAGRGTSLQLIPDIRESVLFSHVNVNDAQQVASYRDFDVIFCRNMLIYFDDVSRREAAENLYDALRPGGYICLGHSESMSRISSVFEVRRFPEAIVYRKPLERQHG